MTNISFTIPVEPVPASRPRVTARGVAYYPKKHTEYHQFLKTHLQGVIPANINGPVAVRMMFVMPPYKTSDHPVHRSDVDNLSKLPMDAMTKATNDSGEPRFWVDDCFVVHLEALKRFAREGEDPRTLITVTAIEESVEDYIDRIYYNV